MKPFVAALLLLLIAVCALHVEGSKCKCSRKGPKIRFSDVQKLEIKPRHPYCEEKMVMYVILRLFTACFLLMTSKSKSCL
ncbi:unnamed protein product [Ranitomeya imitator]|uniref:Chemokine interleukin-8-like domain-containing protein n=1 Tax=Ranitomeya imitator TaxID=111125 RepID=A0ABN9LS60_9NEOB|nr:unnamed protein product [Ranitomeya imitator]